MREADCSWDAGEMGCGEVLIELRFRMSELAAGQIFKLTTRDAGAPEEMPAWCRMTGHKLVEMEHPVYWIEKKSGA